MKPSPSDQKLRGGYYTPPAIARFLARWAIQSASDSVLEPSCGDGNVLLAAAETLVERGATPVETARLIQGIELEPAEAERAGERLHSLGIPSAPDQIHVGDFFTFCRDGLLQAPLFALDSATRRTFDAIVGNPPFIRYQSFPQEYQDIAFALMRDVGLHPNRLTNSWAPFLVISTLLLRDRGRLAMVVPAELLQVSYAAEVREFLSRFYGRITLVTFRGLVFEGIQQEVVLFLGERNGQSAHGIRTVEVSDSQQLAHLADDLVQQGPKPLALTGEKWTQYFLSTDEILLLRDLRGHAQLAHSGQFVEVDVGIVTGENQFFVLTQQAVAQRQLQPYVRPLVSRAVQLSGLRFLPSDWAENVHRQAPAHLLVLPAVEREQLPDAVRAYVAEGEARGVHRGYKCRIRQPWYALRAAWVPDAFMLRQVHAYPKIVLNQTEATCTDTLHRLRFRSGVDGQSVTTAFINSLTFAFAELTGRSYGGGVLTFEPSEAEALPLPLAGVEQIDLTEIDNLLRANRIDAALDITDQCLLVQGLGLSMHQVRELRHIWRTLRDRRIYRTHRPVEREEQPVSARHFHTQDNFTHMEE